MLTYDLLDYNDLVHDYQDEWMINHWVLEAGERI